MINEELAKQYARQLAEMKAKADAWRKANPGRRTEINFNYHHKAFLISAISDAKDAGLVTANEEGWELIKALWPWDDECEPTVAMVRAVLEE